MRCDVHKGRDLTWRIEALKIVTMKQWQTNSQTVKHLGITDEQEEEEDKIDGMGFKLDMKRFHSVCILSMHQAQSN